MEHIPSLEAAGQQFLRLYRELNVSSIPIDQPFKELTSEQRAIVSAFIVRLNIATGLDLCSSNDSSESIQQSTLTSLSQDFLRNMRRAA